MIKINEIKLLEAINNNDLKAIKAMVETEIYNTTLTTTDKKRINAFRKFSKSRSKEVRVSLKGAYIDNDNMLTVCDGYKVARLFANDVKDCLMVDSDLIKDNTSKMVNDTKNLCQLQIQLDIKDIMLQYKKHKATKEKTANNHNYGVYVIEYEGFLKETCYMAFNIEYLKEVHDIFDFTSEIEFYIQDKSHEKNFNKYVTQDDSKDIETLRINNNPLYIESDNGNGIILPIMVRLNPKLIIKNNKE